MKRRYVLGSALIICFLAIAIYSLVNSDIEYSDFIKAKAKIGRKIQVKGQWVREKQSEYLPEKNEFSFFMKDENNIESPVIFKGSKPNNFEIASHIVVTGKFENNIFYATEILTKCPSKYEGQKYNPDSNK